MPKPSKPPTATIRTAPVVVREAFVLRPSALDLTARADEPGRFYFHHPAFEVERAQSAALLALQASLRALSPDTAAIVVRKNQERIRRNRLHSPSR